VPPHERNNTNHVHKERADRQSVFPYIGFETTTLEIIYEQEQIAVEFVVSEVENQEANKMWGQVVSTDRMQIHLVNFRQLMPSQVLGPFDLGTMAGRPLTIVVQVTGIKNTACKFIAYSFIWEPKMANLKVNAKITAPKSIDINSFEPMSCTLALRSGFVLR